VISEREEGWGRGGGGSAVWRLLVCEAGLMKTPNQPVFWLRLSLKEAVWIGYYGSGVRGRQTDPGGVIKSRHGCKIF